MDKDFYVLMIAGMKFGNKRKFRYGTPPYTGPFGALDVGDITKAVSMSADYL
jgi:hypothetical protein